MFLKMKEHYQGSKETLAHGIDHALTIREEARMMILMKKPIRLLGVVFQID